MPELFRLEAEYLRELSNYRGKKIKKCVDTLSEDEKVSFVLDSLLGGYETTSLLMAMVVHLLGQSPTASEQLKLEHEQIRSSKEREEFLNWEDYKRWDSLKMSSMKPSDMETLPPIPSGWKVLPVFTAVHLDSSVHADALQFHPWRWEAQDQTCKKFTPFGGGSRCCPGSELAKIEIAFFLHHLLQNFRWTAEDVDQPMAYPYVEFGKGLLINLDRCSI
ncbi:cytochrome P450 [Salix suchowensis]|nr:cytochrome P450 [Salix suchowensis]